jgi:CheY-like chemotaxis protein
MPVLDGLRLAKEIRKNEELHPGKRPVQLVFATGHEIGDTIERVGTESACRGGT